MWIETLATPIRQRRTNRPSSLIKVSRWREAMRCSQRWSTGSFGQRLRLDQLRPCGIERMTAAKASGRGWW
jgi:hypothetical protein